MRNTDKKQVITEFLQHLKDKDIHLFEIGKFDKGVSTRSKYSLQSSHRTMINVCGYS